MAPTKPPRTADGRIGPNQRSDRYGPIKIGLQGFPTLKINNFIENTQPGCDQHVYLKALDAPTGCVGCLGAIDAANLVSN